MSWCLGKRSHCQPLLNIVKITARKILIVSKGGELQSDTSESKRFQILSLDGGGIKGIFSAAILTKLEEDLGVKVTDHFDLIAGTSTGGILALGLGAGLRPKELLDFYIQHGAKIFSSPRLRGILQYFARKYSRKPLENALSSCLKEKKLGDSAKRLVITSYSLTDNDVYLFRTSHCEHLMRDYKLTMQEVALATSAAPTYFSAYKGIDNIRLVDGGVWANNPIMVALTEASAFLKVELKDIHALSIGTTEEHIRRKKCLNWGGLLQWAKPVSGLIMQGQSIAATNQARNLLGTSNFYRIDSSALEGEFSLDSYNSKDDLMAKASFLSRKISSEFKNRFCLHRAQEFKPIRRESE